MKKLKGNFTTIPNKFIVNNELDVYEFRALCYLCKICDNNNACYPSQQTIANNTNISIAKVKKAVKRLMELGIVTVENRFKENGSNNTNIYVIRAEPDGEFSEDTTPGLSESLPDSIPENLGGLPESYNQYTNINTNSFINTHHPSIEEILEQAEIDNISNQNYIDFKSAIEKMYNQKSISVCGKHVPKADVRKRFKNISYEHIVHVDNNMPRKIVDGKAEIQVVNKVPYIISSLYDCLQYTREQIIKMDYGDDVITDKPNDTS